MEGGGKALSDPDRSPAEFQDRNVEPDSGVAEGDVTSGRRSREPIRQPWTVSYVGLLGTLEIQVVDGPPPDDSAMIVGQATALHRPLDLAEVQGLGPLAKSALLALVINLRNGRTPAQFGEAMEGQPVAPLALQSHLSAVRRTGLVVKLRSGIYRLDGLSRSQVDVLCFEDLYHEIRRLRTAEDEDSRAALISKAEKALSLWRGDPQAAHSYFEDKATLKQFSGWYVDVLAWYARALLRRREPDDFGMAARLIDRIDQHPEHHVLLAELRQEVRLARGATRTALPDAADSRPAQWAAPSAAGDPEWLPRYRDCLRELAAAVDLRGFSSEILSSSSLSAVYTPLYVKPRTSERPPPGQRTDAARPLLETVVGHTRATMIVGESGSGKSTFLLHLCASYIDGGAQGIPLFLDLGASMAIPEERLDGQGRLPWQILPELCSARFADLGVEISAQDLDALARTRPVMWLVDGLNEISSADVRLALTDAISTCARRWQQARFVVTTTETGIYGYGTPPGFQRADVDEFRTEDVEYFLTAFFREHDGDRTAEQQRQTWEPLARAVRESAELREMARSPLGLTAIALAYLRDNQLPDSRADMLRGAVDWLIHKKAPMLRQYVRTGRDLRMVFAELAFQMFVKEETPVSRVGIAWATDRLAPLGCFRGEVRDFLDAAISAGGLLIPRGPGDLGMHDAFRDYLAASHIAAKTDDPATGWWSELAPHLDDPEWHSVIALVPGALLLLGGSARVDLFFDQLGASCVHQGLRVRAGRISLGGRILHELGLSGYRLSRAPRWADAVRSVRELLDEPSDVPLDVRYGAAVAYGIMGDDRLAHPSATWISIPAGRFWMGAQAVTPSERNFDPDAAPWEGPVVQVEISPFAIRKYPITVGEYRAFMDAGGYEETGVRYWTQEGWSWRNRLHVRRPIDWDTQLAVPNAPVSGVSWHECMAYCAWLTEQDDRGYIYRLPHEREWEYAAKRDVGTSQFRWGNRMQSEDDAEANWAGTFLRKKTPVGIFPQSTTTDGIADLFGNVEEWCMDSFEGDILHLADPAAPGIVAARRAAESPADWHEAKRVVRGGSFIRFSRLCRPTYRSKIRQDRRYLSVGFRPVRLPGPSRAKAPRLQARSVPDAASQGQ